MLRKSLAADAWAVILKNWFFLELLQVKKLSKFELFCYLKLVSVSIIKKMTFIVCVKPN